MNFLLGLVWLVTLLWFIGLYKQKKDARLAAGENYQNDETYQAISKKKRIVGIVCIASLLINFAIGPSNKDAAKENKPAATTTTQQQTQQPKEEAAAPAPTPAPAETPESKIKAKVQQYVKEYPESVIDGITVNPNLGTEKDGDYVVLVNLTWNRQNSGERSKEMLTMFSSDMAARMYEDLPEVQELAVFWNVPYLNAKAKVSFERASGGMKFSDQMFGPAFRK